MRSGTPAEDTNQLIPFHDLMARLEREQQGEHGRGPATKGD
ncbi:hypothetical protein [Corynebacterium sp. TAE3-ERU2]